MKHMAWALSFALTGVSAFSQGYAEIDRGPHHRAWQSVKEITLPNGRKRLETNSFIELQTGLHRRTERGWEVSDPKIEIINNGAQGVARNLPYSVTFAGNLNTQGAIDLTLPGGERVTAHILGLSFTEGDRSVMIAEIKDCAGVIVGDAQNELTFIDAFTDFVIDVQFVVRPDGVSQNIILKQQLPSPTQYGLTEDAIFEVLTEFTAFPAVHKELRGTVQGLRSEYVRLGSMEFVTGRAFSLDNRDTAAPMRKSWELFEGGRSVLLEKVPWREIAPEVTRLPPLSQNWRRRTDPVVMANNRRRLPERREALAMVNPLRHELTPVGRDATPLASALRKTGFVLDWELVSSQNSFRWTNGTTFYLSGPVSIKTNFWEPCVVKFAPTNTAKITITGPSTWLSEPYTPVIMTARDDHSVGQAIGNNPLAGVYANTALVLDYNASGVLYDLHDVSIKHALTGINVYFGREHTLRNVQLFQCDMAINGHSSTYQLLNGLLSRCNVALHATTMSGATGIVQNATFSQCNNFSAYGNYVLTNSLLLGVTNVAGFVGAFNGTNSNHAAAVQTVGAGGAYLQAGSPFRDSGTTNINPNLLASLGQLTTYPPLVLASIATIENTNWNLFPQAERDITNPDKGWHYPPIDYAVGGAYLLNSTLTLNPGTALAVFSPTNAFGGYYGLALADGAAMYCEGSPTNLNRIVRYSTVQEMTATSWNTSPLESVASDYAGAIVAPKARYRFTQWSIPAADAIHFYGYYGADMTPAFVDCQFHGGKFWSERPWVSVTNCLFDRVAIAIQALDYELRPAFQNCLFYGGTLTLQDYIGGTWTFTNNVFDRVAISQSATLAHNFNGYITNSTGQRLTPTAANDTATNNFGWQTGALGKFYQPTTSTFINRGSTTANLLGLYHFTAVTNYVKETNSTVDLGLHYVATTANGLPTDQDGDNLPDHFEDADGDGVLDSGVETNFANTDTDGDGVSDYIERLQGRNPLVSGTAADIGNQINLRIYTPLK